MSSRFPQMSMTSVPCSVPIHDSLSSCYVSLWAPLDYCCLWPGWSSMTVLVWRSVGPLSCRRDLCCDLVVVSWLDWGHGFWGGRLHMPTTHPRSHPSEVVSVRFCHGVLLCFSPFHTHSWKWVTMSWSYWRDTESSSSSLRVEDFLLLYRMLFSIKNSYFKLV